MPTRRVAPDASEVSAKTPTDGAAGLPSAAALLACLLLLGAAYAVAIWRGPAPAGEVQVVIYPPPASVPEAAAE